MSIRTKCVASSVLMAAIATGAHAQLLADGVPTIFLQADQGVAPMTVAYHPGFNQYYASGGGYPGNPGFVWDAAGNLIQGGTGVGVDVRAWNWNPNTGQLEIVPYGAQGGVYPLVTPDLDGSGFITGSNTSLLGSMPGIRDFQSSAAYDASRNVFYSTGFADPTVNVSRRSDGGLDSQVVLDLAAAGVNASQIMAWSIAYLPSQDWLLVGDAANNRVLAFEVDGSFVGATNLQTNLNSYPYYHLGYTNEQLFVFDVGLNGWQGYTILIPAPGALAALGMAGVVAARRRR